MEESIWTRLAKPFTDAELEWKPQTIGRDKNKNPYAVVVPYVAARAIMDRLDQVVGPADWTTALRPVVVRGEEGFVCELSVRTEGGWVTREDVAPASDIEPMKGAASGALKRVAVQFGIGRYLYALPVYRIFSGDIQDGYPPKDVHDAIILKSKEHDVLGWCHAPKLREARTATTAPDLGEDVPFPSEQPVWDEDEQKGHEASKPTEPLGVGKIARTMKSKFDNGFCAFCGHKHIPQGQEIVGVDGIPGKDKTQWGYGECYEMWSKERGA